ncbi:hypothetical protein HJC23_013288 [Cyclotella cryptica]|uniref:Uncharacterized protein n=1 Tax=Cyclotella cryptica TaxID=29204 RepID=A0ABD3PBN6_9STRA|eukprot:CCRYP_016092-RA/>CCRYP_016092-RA protein AED:0.38 eAED:0.38 QI:0/-1/0/1/-1/1/1/0/367
MFGCVELNCGSDPATRTIVNDTAAHGPASNNVNNSDNAYASNDNELVENPAASNALSVATHQNQGRCPFKQCLSDTFNACQPPSITDDKATKSSFVANDNQDHHDNANKDDERSTQILQQLGIRHLEDKLTRPRLSQETDEHILREAGAARYHFVRQDVDEDDDNNNFTQDEREVAEKIKLKSLTAREAQILREAGVTWMDHMHIDPCHTATTVGATATDSYVTAEHSSRDYTRLHGGVNNTYAEKELLRRLKNGWVSTGIDCNECGMPIICQKEGGEGLMECIICGVMEFNEEGAAHSTPLGENVGVDDETISCFDTTITSGFTIASHGQSGLIQITVDPVKRFYRPTIPPSQLIMRHIVRPTKKT